MGWLWSSSQGNGGSQDREGAPTGHDVTDAVHKKGARGFGLTEEQQLRIFGKTSTNPPSQNDATNTDATADAELEAFLKSLESSEAQDKSSATSNVSSTASPTRHPAASPPSYDRRLPDGTLDISPDVLLPRTMSCRQAFDQAFYCQSLGGKFNDIYRYGQLRSCSEHWGAFWFCMRTRTLNGEDKEQQIVEWHRQREERKTQSRGSSEDVWPLRQDMVRKAFHKDPDAGEEGHEITLRE